MADTFELLKIYKSQETDEVIFWLRIRWLYENWKQCWINPMDWLGRALRSVDMRKTKKKYIYINNSNFKLTFSVILHPTPPWI